VLKVNKILLALYSKEHFFFINILGKKQNLVSSPGIWLLFLVSITAPLYSVAKSLIMQRCQEKQLSFICVIKNGEKQFGIRIEITSKSYIADYAQSSNSHGYCTWWPQYGVNFISLENFY